MSEALSDQRVVVTAEERTHPALRKLARAMIALARHQLNQSAPSYGKPRAAGSEAAHD
ncbi:hypothetical protein EV186_104370 [Labedaea rhizosphaerae]|uniref:Uncharacterized protein n=1 Tax=Labedaea rhizosphaerae TaxID=598644 RepID=A0A4R6SBW4_LABRH|nr:hypothetical protein EV186_104370 [Labedaea rhizosphaerae]